MFAPTSRWNARPTVKTFGTAVIPATSSSCLVSEGSLAPLLLTVDATTGYRNVYGPGGPAAGPGISCPDEARFVDHVTVRIPANVIAPNGGDGHVDIVDLQARVVHSFYQVYVDDDGNYRSTQYTWTALDGLGMPDGAHYCQGSRATGILPSAGVITEADWRSDADRYGHTLAMSGATTTQSPDFVFPASSTDAYAPGNTGPIPAGAYLALPPTFNVDALVNPEAKRIARTLMERGAYMVDGNGGVPFIIYAAYGSGYEQLNGSNAAADLDLIRSSLRQIIGADDWIDADGNPFTPPEHVNMLSLRGPWSVTSGGPEAGVFDTYLQALVFPDGQAVTQVNANANGFGRNSSAGIPWATPAAGAPMRLQVSATAGAQLRIDWHGAFDTGFLADGADVLFPWPAGFSYTALVAQSGPGGGGTLGVTLTQVDAPSVPVIVPPAPRASAWSDEIAEAFGDLLDSVGEDIMWTDADGLLHVNVDQTYPRALFKSPGQMVLQDMQISDEYAIEYRDADFPGMDRDDRLEIRGLVFRVKEIPDGDDAVLKTARLARLNS